LTSAADSEENSRFTADRKSPSKEALTLTGTSTDASHTSCQPARAVHFAKTRRSVASAGDTVQVSFGGGIGRTTTFSFEGVEAPITTGGVDVAAKALGGTIVCEPAVIAGVADGDAAITFGGVAAVATADDGASGAGVVVAPGVTGLTGDAPNTIGARGVGMETTGADPGEGSGGAELALGAGVAPGWLTSAQSPVGKVNFGAELHPKSKAAQRSSLAMSLQFMTNTFLDSRNRYS